MAPDKGQRLSAASIATPTSLISQYLEDPSDTTALKSQHGLDK